jgi:hypothetical protein
MTRKTISIAWLAAALATAAVTGSAAAGTLNGPSTIVNPPTGCATTQPSPCPENYSFAPGTSTTNTPVTDGPTTYTFADTFNQTGSTSTASDFGVSAYTSGPKCPTNPNCLNSSPLLTWNFQDNYDFTTPSNGPNVQGAVLSFTIPNYGVGLSNVEARIIAYNPGAQDPASLVSTSAVTIVDGWQSVSSGGSLDLYIATLNNTPLAASTEYVLQIRGEAMTAASYIGAVTFTPVPLPLPLLLLLSGFAGLVLLARSAPRGVSPIARVQTA